MLVVGCAAVRLRHALGRCRIPPLWLCCASRGVFRLLLCCPSWSCEYGAAAWLQLVVRLRFALVCLIFGSAVHCRRVMFGAHRALSCSTFVYYVALVARFSCWFSLHGFPFRVAALPLACSWLCGCATHCRAPSSALLRFAWLCWPSALTAVAGYGRRWQSRGGVWRRQRSS